MKLYNNALDKAQAKITGEKLPPTFVGTWCTYFSTTRGIPALIYCWWTFSFYLVNAIITDAKTVELLVFGGYFAIFPSMGMFYLCKKFR